MGTFFRALLGIGEILVLRDMFKKHRSKRQVAKRPKQKNRGCLTLFTLDFK